MNPDVFPYVVECPDCPHNTTAEITREEATEALETLRDTLRNEAGAPQETIG